MKFFYSVLCCIVMQAAHANCGPPAPKFTSEFMKQMLPLAQDRGLLFAARKGPSVTWLYGTIHVAKPEWSIPGPHLRKLFFNPRYLALEVDLLNSSTQNIIGQEAATGDSNGQPLSAGLKRLAFANCVNYSILATSNSATVISAVEANQARLIGLFPEYGIDIVLAGAARARHIDIEQLESPYGRQSIEQGEVKNSETSMVQVEAALTSGQAKDDLMQISEGWAQSSLKTLEESGYFRNIPADMEAQRSLRNQHLASAIDQLVVKRGGGGIVAIGVLHLVGENSVLKFIEERGYEVNRVY